MELLIDSFVGNNISKVYINITQSLLIKHHKENILVGLNMCKNRRLGNEYIHFRIENVTHG